MLSTYFLKETLLDYVSMFRYTQILLAHTIVIICCYCTVVTAHEFWINPTNFVVESNENISADLRVGQMMSGVNYSFFPKNFKLINVKAGKQVKPIAGRMGDKPAIQIGAQGHHLVTLFLVTTDNIVSYHDWSQFEKFLREKNLTDVEKEHKTNNFPATQFKEIYRRYAKALIGSGKSLGFDQKIGLETEIVLKQNPYIESLSNGLTIKLYYKGSPQEYTQVEVFSQTAGQNAKKEILFTNKLGEAIVNVYPETDYLINSVIMRRPVIDKATLQNSKEPILWESLWASTTFRVP